MAINRPIYRSDGWVLGYCEECLALNYVEPHGTTAECKQCEKTTEYHNIPQECRDVSGTLLIKPILPPRDDSTTLSKAHHDYIRGLITYSQYKQALVKDKPDGRTS